jgi:O-Antigen ligase
VRLIEAAPDRGWLVPAAIAMAALATAIATSTGAVALSTMALPAGVLVLSAAAYRSVIPWHRSLAVLVVVILLIPIRRYSMPGNLPFELEPYRVVVLLLAVGWIATLLVDRGARVRKTGLEGPLALILFAALTSVAFNHSRVAGLGVTSDVMKKLSFLVSFLVVLYLITSSIKRIKEIDAVLSVLVGGTAVLAVLTVIEGRTHFNPFNHLSGVIPLLRFNGLAWSLTHDERARPFASAQSPIALGAVFVIVLPMAIYLARKTHQNRWWLAGALLIFGSFATRSRTSILMLLAVVIVYAWLRPRELRRFWPALLPILLVAHIASPGTFKTLKDSFLPKGGLVAQQASGAGTYGSGRVADLAPSLKEWRNSPIFGEGYGTRVVDQTAKLNARILDDEWLGTLLEVGLVGTFAWAWLFIRFIRRAGRRAKTDRTPQGWLAVGLTASIVAYAMGMATYDAFSFIQVTFVLFILFGVGSAALALEPRKTRTEQA